MCKPSILEDKEVVVGEKGFQSFIHDVVTAEVSGEVRPSRSREKSGHFLRNNWHSTYKDENRKVAMKGTLEEQGKEKTSKRKSSYWWNGMRHWKKWGSCPGKRSFSSKKAVMEGWGLQSVEESFPFAVRAGDCILTSRYQFSTVERAFLSYSRMC